jgi:hypothetical protein
VNDAVQLDIARQVQCAGGDEDDRVVGAAEGGRPGDRRVAFDDEKSLAGVDRGAEHAGAVGRAVDPARCGLRSLRSALASIWRMRSRVTANDWPTSSPASDAPSEAPGGAPMRSAAAPMRPPA